MKASLRNAVTAMTATAASTNAILHLLAIAREAGVAFDIDVFDEISRTTPVIGDLKPGGQYMAFDLYEAGGSAVVGKRLKEGRPPERCADCLPGALCSRKLTMQLKQTGKKVVRTFTDPVKFARWLRYSLR